MIFSVKILIFIISALSISIEAEVYTAVTELEDAIEVERIHIETLKAFVNFNEQQIKYFKWKINEYTVKNDVARFDVDEYLANPLNAFLLIKRVTSEWRDTIEKLSNNVANDVLTQAVKAKENLKIPDFTDLQGIAAGIARLQKIYDMKASDMADGILNGIDTNLKMEARDCFDLAVEMYNNKNFPESLLWLEEATDRLSQRDYPQLETSIKTYVAMNHLEDGNITFALEIVNEIVENYPENEVAIETKEEIENRINDLKMVNGKLPPVTRYRKPEEMKKKGPLTFAEIVEQFEKNKFESLCRNGTSLSPKQMTSFKCRYVTNNNPFLKIGPIKAEEVSLNPYIVVYHDLVYDEEMDYIHDNSKPKFKRSTIELTGKETDNEIILSRRTSKSAFMDHNPVIEKIFQRLTALTNLSMDFCEQLQVVNYGIGGHYNTHFDFYPVEHPIPHPELGNRISTLLIYLSEVELGGATVFPYLDLAIQPVRGSAVFWYNIQESGNPDYHTRHGACPVLFGSKWIANLWTRSYGQDLKRLCGLKQILPTQVFIPGIGLADL